MKKYIYALAFASLAIINTASAQKGFSVSVKATPQLSFLYNKDDKDNSRFDYKATFNASFGIGAEYGFSKNLGVGADVLYSLQGQRYTLGSNDYNQKVDYVKVPVYFTYTSDASKAVSFIGKVGPQVSFITTSKLTNDDGDDIKGDTKDAYKNVTFGGAALAGVQFKVAPQTFLTTAVRFDSDFTNAEDKDYVGHVQGRAKTYNITTGVEVGLKFML